MKAERLGLAAVLLAVWGTAGLAQNFTTAAEVKPILAATRASWVAVREFDGNDLVYFTHLESWRCGLSQIRFSVNSAAAATIWETEPCYEDAAQPNALKLEEHLPYIVLPLGMVQTLSVVVVYDDGSEERAEFTRQQVLMP